MSIAFGVLKQEATLAKVKDLISTAPVLKYLDPTKTTVIMVSEVFFIMVKGLQVTGTTSIFVPDPGSPSPTSTAPGT